jgi:hypothetical protein
VGLQTGYVRGLVCGRRDNTVAVVAVRVTEERVVDGVCGQRLVGTYAGHEPLQNVSKVEARARDGAVGRCGSLLRTPFVEMAMSGGYGSSRSLELVAQAEARLQFDAESTLGSARCRRRLPFAHLRTLAYL